MSDADRLDIALARVCIDLTTRDVPFALVGGLAVSLRSRVRFTRDIDLAIKIASDAEVESLTLALQASGYRVKALVEQDEQNRIATVRLVAPAGVVVDLLCASSGLEREIVDRAPEEDWATTLRVRVARREELVALKVLAMTDSRPNDRADALALRDAGIDEATVEENLWLIQSRGFARKQDLLAKFRQL